MVELVFHYNLVPNIRCCGVLSWHLLKTRPYKLYYHMVTYLTHSIQSDNVTIIMQVAKSCCPFYLSDLLLGQAMRI